MLADTLTVPENTRRFRLNWLAALRLLVSERFNNKRALSAEHLPESHYRDLGLSPRRHDAVDTRPLIILGPM